MPASESPARLAVLVALVAATIALACAPPAQASLTAAPPAGSFVAIGAGPEHACAVRSDAHGRLLGR